MVLVAADRDRGGAPRRGKSCAGMIEVGVLYVYSHRLDPTDALCQFFDHQFAISSLLFQQQLFSHKRTIIHSVNSRYVHLCLARIYTEGSVHLRAEFWPEIFELKKHEILADNSESIISGFVLMPYELFLRSIVYFLSRLREHMRAYLQNIFFRYILHQLILQGIDWLNFVGSLHRTSWILPLKRCLYLFKKYISFFRALMFGYIINMKVILDPETLIY